MHSVPLDPTAATWRFRLEAAVVVGIITIIVAAALPRIYATRTAAREVRLKMLFATVQSAAMLFHVRCAALPSGSDAACARLPLQGSEIDGVNGWPAARAEGIAKALKSWGDTADIEWQSEQFDGLPAMRARLTSATVAGTCEFLYAQAASPGAAPRMEMSDATCPE